MRDHHLIEVLENLKKKGYEVEVPVSVLNKELVHFVGYDKYKLKYTLEVLVDVGYFSWSSSNLKVLKINGLNGGVE